MPEVRLAEAVAALSPAIDIGMAALATPDGDIPATGRPITLPFAVVFQFEGDLARSVHVYFDQLGFLAQLGLVPVPQAA